MTALQPGTSNAEWVRSVFTRVFEQRDFSEARDFCSDESTNYFLATGEAVSGATALTAWFTSLFAAVPDWRLEVENIVDDGEGQVVVQWRGTGTFTGSAFQGIDATGRLIDLRGLPAVAS